MNVQIRLFIDFEHLFTDLNRKKGSHFNRFLSDEQLFKNKPKSALYFHFGQKTEEIIIRSSDLSFISNENTVEKLIQNHSVLASLTDNLVNFLVKWKRLYVRTGRFTI